MIFMIERRMVGFGGHEATQLSAISQLSNGQPVNAITTTDLPSGRHANGTDIHRLLTSRKITKSSAIDPRKICSDAASLKRFFAGGKATDCDIIIIPSTNIYEILMIFEFYRIFKTQMQTHLRFVTANAFSDIGSENLSIMRKLINQKKLYIHTENASLSDWLNSSFRLNSKADFILPCTLVPDAALAAFQADRQTKSNNFTIGYLGGLRREKGKMMIPDIIKALRKILASEPGDIKLDFVMQNHRHAKNFIANRYYDWRMALKLLPTYFASRHVKITKTPGDLEEKEFLDVLASVDLLILPYDPDLYKMRSSGIIYDGVLALKPFVHTSGMGANEFLVFGNAEPANNPNQFAAKIVKIIKDIDSYRNGAVAAREHLTGRIKQTAILIKSMPLC